MWDAKMKEIWRQSSEKVQVSCIHHTQFVLSLTPDSATATFSAGSVSTSVCKQDWKLLGSVIFRMTSSIVKLPPATLIFITIVFPDYLFLLPSLKLESAANCDALNVEAKYPSYQTVGWILSSIHFGTLSQRLTDFFFSLTVSRIWRIFHNRQRWLNDTI